MSSQPRRTLAELRAAVRQRIPVSENDTQITYDVIDGFINSALRQISVEHDWPWLLTYQDQDTTANREYVEVPSTWLSTKTILETGTSVVLRHKHLDDILEEPNNSTGRPALYVITSELIVLRPVPDGVYTLRHYFYRSEPVVAGDQAKPLIPHGFDEGVIEYAAYLGLRYKREEERAQLALKSYNDWLRRTADNLVESKSPRPPRVRPGSLI